jgi:hypothetical protein
VEIEPDQGPSVLIIELFAGEGERWYIRVLGQGEPERYALTPITLVVRLWPVPNSNARRGSVSVRDSDSWAGFQYSDQLEALVRDWLTGGTPGQERPSHQGT